jgi:molybdopterin-guanine dinucleotide biosynthesis protein A
MKRPSKLQAVVLTGKRDSHNPLIAGLGLQSKAMLPILGRPMVLYVLEAIAASEYQPEIYVSTADPAVAALDTQIAYKTLPSEDRAVQSLLRSMDRLPEPEWVLFASGDHPLLTPEMIDYFVDEVVRRDLTFGVAAVSRSQVNRSYPQSKRTYFPVKGDAFSGGNLFMVNRPRFQGSVDFMETIDRNRKKPWKSVFMVNTITALRIFMRQMDIHEVAREGSRIFKCEAGIVDMPFAECCMDVDKPSDKEIAAMILQQRREVSCLAESDRIQQPLRYAGG